MARREFKTAVKVAIVKRATRDGVVTCEACGLPTKRWHIDHTDPDALKIDKSRALTVDDGQLLCAGSRFTCHGKKTAEEDIPAIAKAKRREARHIGASRPAGTLRSRARDAAAPQNSARTPEKCVARKPMFVETI